MLGSVSGPLHGVRDMGHPEDHCVESPERFDEFTGPFSSSGTGHDAHTTGARTPRSFDADAFVKSTFTPIQIAYMLTGDWDCIASAVRMAYLTGKVDGGKEIADAVNSAFSEAKQ